MIDKITDEEVNILFEYRQKVEDEFLQSKYGKRIKGFEKLGIGITFEEALESYIEKAGIITDKVGNVILEEECMNAVYQENLEIISKQIGYDITQFGFDKIERIIQNEDYAFAISKNIKKEEIEEEKNILELFGIKECDKSLFEICTELKIPEASYATSLSDFSKILKRTGIPIEKVDAYIKKYEKNTIDTFIESQEDIYLIESISYLHLIREGKLSLDYESEKQMFLSIAETFKNSKYYQSILNENKQVDVEKAEKFYLEFIEARNSSDLTRKLSKYFTYTKILDMETEKDVFVTVLRAYKSNDPIQIKNAIEISKNLKLDVLGRKGLFNERKLQRYGKKFFGKSFDADKIVHLSEFNDDTIEENLDRIMGSILDYEPIPSIKTVDTVNEYKEKQKQKEKVTCCKKDELAMSILNGRNNMSTEQILAIYCKFRSLELNERRIVNSNKAPVELTASNMAIPQNYGVASIVRKYIIENKEKFSEYLTESGDLENKKIIDALKDKNFSFNEQIEINSVFGEIRRQTKSIDRKEKEHFSDIESLKVDIRILSRGQLSDAKKKEMFKKAKHLQKDNILPTELIEKLKEVDPENFEKTFKKSDIEARIEDGSFRAFIYGKVGVSFRKAFVELPNQIFTRNKDASNVFGIDKSMIKSLRKMRATKEKLAKKLELGNLREERKETQRNLPAVRKESIFDKVKKAFSRKREENVVKEEEDRKIPQNVSDKSTNNQTVENESLTSEEKSGTTITTISNNLDYLKAETPIAKPTASKDDKSAQVENRDEAR